MLDNYRPLPPGEVARVAYELCKPMLMEAHAMEGDAKREHIVKLMMGLARGLTTIAARFLKSDPEDFAEQVRKFVAEEVALMREEIAREENGDAGFGTQEAPRETESLWDA